MLYVDDLKISPLKNITVLATEDHQEFNDMQIQTNTRSNNGERTTYCEIKLQAWCKILERSRLLVMETMYQIYAKYHTCRKLFPNLLHQKGGEVTT